MKLNDLIKNMEFDKIMEKIWKKFEILCIRLVIFLKIKLLKYRFSYHLDLVQIVLKKIFSFKGQS